MNHLVNNKVIFVFRHNEIPHVVIIDMKRDAVVYLEDDEIKPLVDGLLQEELVMPTMDIHDVCLNCRYGDLSYEYEPCASCRITRPTHFTPRKEGE